MSQRQAILLAILLPILLQIVGGAFLQQGIRRSFELGQPGASGVVEAGWYISLLCPLPFGLWLGLKWPGSHATAYILIGLTIGLIGLFAYRIILSIVLEPIVGRPPDSADWVHWITIWPVLSTFLYTVGGILGDSLEERIREEWVVPLIGLATAAITAIGSILSLLGSS